MPITINKNSSATILTINNFANLVIDGNTPSDALGDIVGTETNAILIKAMGPSMQISFEYTLTTEAADVVSGTGSPVTTAVGQMKYLYDTLMSTGTTSFSDTYTLTVDFGGGVTFARTGVITKITCQMASDQPLTFRGSITFQVGTVA